MRPVPAMPSSPARRCSSGSSIPDRPLPRRRALPVVPEAAGASVVPAASCAPVSTRSVVSLTYRSFPAVTCAFQRRGCPGPLRSGPRAGTQKGTGRKDARRISGEERSSASAPREARPSGRLRREPRRSSRTGQHRWVPVCSSLSRRYLRRPGQHLCPDCIDLQREGRPPRWGECGTARRRRRRRGQHQHARPGAGDDGGQPAGAQRVDQRRATPAWRRRAAAGAAGRRSPRAAAPGPGSARAPAAPSGRR